MELVGFSGLQTVFGGSTSLWKARIKAGLPVKFDPGLHSGKPRVYDSEDVHQWLVEQATGQPGNLIPAQEKAHLDLVSRQLKELDLASRKGDLLDAALVEKVWSGLTGAARQRLLGLPNRLASECNGQEFSIILSRSEELIHECLNELHQYDPNDYGA